MDDSRSRHEMSAGRPGRAGGRKLALVLAAIATVVALAALLNYALTQFFAPRAGLTPAIAVSAGPATRTASPDAATVPLHDRPRDVASIRFADGEGRPRTLADFRGKTVLLNIWATWCVPCRREMPTLDRLQAALGGPDFEVVALSIDRGGIEAVRKFYAEVGVRNLAMYIDETGRIARDLNAFGLPTTLLIDRKGSEIGRLVGPAEWDSPEMIASLRKHLKTSRGESS